jgi:hypothetical protein
MKPVSADDRALARAAAGAFGGVPRVTRYYDESEQTAIDILMCADRPTEGFATYSTLGLHHAPNVLEGDDIRVELAGVCTTEDSFFGNLLAEAAFDVIKDLWLCAPGVVFPDVVRHYEVSTPLRHVVWVPPFPWEQLGSVSLGEGHDVHWLLAIPISESERRFLIANGYDAFDEAFSKREVPYYDLKREPIF